jgi:hypothetical protein
MKRIKRLDEFVAAEPATKPTTAPPTTAPPITRPNRPIPTKRPGEKTKEKPMAELENVLDLFFSELEEVKDTPMGKSMIKKLHRKYAKNQ